MFGLLSYTTLALSGFSLVSALAIPRSSPPPGWATDYLEPYTDYHVRYIAIGCTGKQGQPFFEECCHPLLATESLETARAPHCIPSASASSSASAIEPTSTVTTPVDSEDDEDCDEEDEAHSESSVVSAPSAAPVTLTPTPTPTPTPSEVKEAPKETPKPTTSAKAEPVPTVEVGDKVSANVNTGGFATFFYQNGVAGACGTVHSDNDMIAAIDADRYGFTGTKSPLCGKQVKITNASNKKSVVVTIADACPTCNNGNSIDLSVAAFKHIATLDEGLVDISWSFL